MPTDLCLTIFLIVAIEACMPGSFTEPEPPDIGVIITGLDGGSE